MIKDLQLQLASAQAVTASAFSQSVIDQGAKGDAYEDALWLVVRSNVSFGSTDGTATLQVKVQTADALDGSNNLSSGVDLMLSPVRAVSALAAGAEIYKARMPRGSHRYLQLYFVVGTESFTAGSLDAFLTPDPESVGQMLRPAPAN